MNASYIDALNMSMTSSKMNEIFGNIKGTIQMTPSLIIKYMQKRLKETYKTYERLVIEIKLGNNQGYISIWSFHGNDLIVTFYLNKIRTQFDLELLNSMMTKVEKINFLFERNDSGRKQQIILFVKTKTETKTETNSNSNTNYTTFDKIDNIHELFAKSSIKDEGYTEILDLFKQLVAFIPPPSPPQSEGGGTQYIKTNEKHGKQILYKKGKYGKNRYIFKNQQYIKVNL